MFTADTSFLRAVSCVPMTVLLCVLGEKGLGGIAQDPLPLKLRGRGSWETFSRPFTIEIEAKRVMGNVLKTVYHRN